MLWSGSICSTWLRRSSLQNLHTACLRLCATVLTISFLMSQILYVHPAHVYMLYVILLMEEILHQLIGSLHQYLQGFYFPGGAGFLPSTVSTQNYIHLHNIYAYLHYIDNLISFPSLSH